MNDISERIPSRWRALMSSTTHGAVARSWEIPVMWQSYVAATGRVLPVAARRRSGKDRLRARRYRMRIFLIRDDGVGGGEHALREVRV